MELPPLQPATPKTSPRTGLPVAVPGPRCTVVHSGKRHRVAAWRLLVKKEFKIPKKEISTKKGAARRLRLLMYLRFWVAEKRTPKINERDFAVEFVVDGLYSQKAKKGSDSKRSSRANGMSPSLLELWRWTVGCEDAFARGEAIIVERCMRHDSRQRACGSSWLSVESKRVALATIATPSRADAPRRRPVAAVRHVTAAEAPATHWAGRQKARAALASATRLMSESDRALFAAYGLETD
ncbi:hypothetical protein EMIHUDRAFT_255588 [Emiliania huxleyi CCMP1516]|uniref:Uncharacterized protein n=2 Tax=Emiliania huxleyi TaxID=2903 RepID=A0A0D3J8F1_EMIH1|nr:hypothetical protein EMIHUDRAFT_255588 [Emiliania huxleyi CCMP1516]EOD19786.1 hypothetical protein EMIHUDRAFT_255588 [Emiliania huxleyi CCMP1516]|eukprot:XP_005772215.1 hypothetical protein EMIHUDRAFT_255588 [Emiliania huxleyi CCMP1516]